MSSFKFPSGFTIENLTDDEVKELQQAQETAQQEAEMSDTLLQAAIGQPVRQLTTKVAPVAQPDKVDFAAELVSKQFGFDAQGNPISNSNQQPNLHNGQ